MFSGIVREMDIDVTNEQIDEWMTGGNIQDVMPHLTDDEREFIMTGMTSEDWESVCAEEDFLESLDDKIDDLDETPFA